jgi:hypothetical protein
MYKYSLDKMESATDLGIPCVCHDGHLTRELPALSDSSAHSTGDNQGEFLKVAGAAIGEGWLNHETDPGADRLCVEANIFFQEAESAQRWAPERQMPEHAALENSGVNSTVNNQGEFLTFFHAGIGEYWVNHETSSRRRSVLFSAQTVRRGGPNWQIRRPVVFRGQPVRLGGPKRQNRRPVVFRGQPVRL